VSTGSPTLSWLPQGGSVSYPNNSFKVVIYGQNQSQLYSQPNWQTGTSFTIPAATWNMILNTHQEYIYWAVISKQTSYPETGQYYSEYYKLNLPNLDEINADYSSINSTTVNTTEWFLFTAPRLNEYKFYTTGNVDTISELFNSLRADGISSDRLQYDDNSGIGDNFQMIRILEAGETIYLRVTSRSSGSYTLYISSYDLEATYIVLDPITAASKGTEVTMNGGNFSGVTMTEGYTRNAYLLNTAPTISRLEYNWSIVKGGAEISAYGTIIAHNVLGVVASKEILIKAIYRSDGTYAFIMVTVYRDNSILIHNIEVSTDNRADAEHSSGGTEVTSGLGTACANGVAITIHTGKTRFLCFDSGSPSALLQHYTWTSSDASVLYVDVWGIVYAGYVTEYTAIIVTATYIYNPHFVAVYMIMVQPL
jgi:hypothetical protein